MTPIKSLLKWTVAGVLDEIEKLNPSMPDRALAFVLGSGASVTSGIPAGKTMAEFTAILPRLSPDDRILFERLGAAILDEAALSELEQNERWQQVEERPWLGD